MMLYPQGGARKEGAQRGLSINNVARRPSTKKITQDGGKTIMMNKRNKLDIAPKGLILAVTVIIALILSAISLYMVTRGKSTINDGNAQYTDMMSAYSEINATMYDGLIVAGDKVAELADQATNACQVQVFTKGNPRVGDYTANGTDVTTTGGIVYNDGLHYTSATAGQATNINHVDHINTNASFAGKVHKNANGIVDRIWFEQK